MKIELNKITVRQLTEKYEDNAESGVKAFGGKLDVRPPYQREFVYNEKQRNAVKVCAVMSLEEYLSYPNNNPK